ncbi:MAG: radical SAM protein [Candidatus Methanoplasma sp.]|jgi:uncharacterized protein|nr:radical SAM protein [Candidatus Methanoplasma sp.]
MKPFISVIIKPTLACNIGCRHCYHPPEERTGGSISLETLDRLFRLLSEEYESTWFIWHGGEPLMLSPQFYRDAIAMQERYFGKGSHRVGNTIQTNGIRLNKRFMDLCREKKINVGVSYEGPRNDVLRERTSEVENNLDMLIKREHVFSVGLTVSSDTASEQASLYEHFRDRHIAVSFSPVIPAGCAASCPGLVPDVDEYVRGSIDAFDLWLTDTDTEIPLMPHYLYLLNALGEPSESDCAHSSCLTKWLCVYPDGSLYPCAKGCIPEFRMCGLEDVEHISDTFLTDGFRRMLAGTIARREKCRSCDIFDHCGGGCSMDACYEEGLENNGNPSCRIYKELFTQIKDRADRIVSEKRNLSEYNKFVRDAVTGRLIDPTMPL